MADDSELLRQYDREGSQKAFAELVERHVGLVYHAALRQLGGDRHRAEDVTQRVFADLARKAGKLAGHPVLAGWLYRSSRLAALQVVREETRRKKRESETDLMQAMGINSDSGADWDRLRGVIDDVLGSLSEKDQQAVVLRYLSGSAFGDIGSRLGISADAARFRVDRSLEKMRRELSKRGITSTSVALAAALASNACPAAPAGIAAAVTQAALAGAAGPAAGFSFVHLMAAYKQLGLAAAIVAAGMAGTVTEARQQDGLRREIAVLERENTRADLPALLASNHGLRAAIDSGRTQTQPARAPGGPPPKVAMDSGFPKVFTIEMLDHQPRVLDQTKAVYPGDLAGTGLTPTILVDFIVDTQGSVHNAYALDGGNSSKESDERVTLVPTSTDGSPPEDNADLPPEVLAEFKKAAVQAVSQWVFQAGSHGGKTTNTHVRVPVVFDSPDVFVPPAP